MQEAPLTEWVNSPETRLLVGHLRNRRAAAVRAFLAGHPVDSLTQAKAAAFHELDALLTGPVDKLREVLENVLKESKP